MIHPCCPFPQTHSHYDHITHRSITDSTAHTERHWLHVTVSCLPSSTPPTHITTLQWCRTTLLLCEAFLPDLLKLFSFPPPPHPKRCPRAGKLRQALALYWKRSLSRLNHSSCYKQNILLKGITHP